MKYVFVNGRVAVTIRYWEQRGADIEGGARVDIRRVEQVEGPGHRAGAAGFKVGSVGDGGIWRADLFVVLSDGGKPCFHYHPRFRDSDVGDRFDDDLLGTDPRSWIEKQLRNLPAILQDFGAGDLIDSVDIAAHERALALMMLAVDACLAQITTSSVLAAGPVDQIK